MPSGRQVGRAGGLSLRQAAAPRLPRPSAPRRAVRTRKPHLSEDVTDPVRREDIKDHNIFIEVGQAQARPVKGEDTSYVRNTFDRPAKECQLCAAVFDGHGGKAASADALKTVGDRLMDQGPPFTNANIASTHGINALA